MADDLVDSKFDVGDIDCLSVCCGISDDGFVAGRVLEIMLSTDMGSPSSFGFHSHGFPRI